MASTRQARGEKKKETKACCSNLDGRQALAVGCESLRTLFSFSRRVLTRPHGLQLRLDLLHVLLDGLQHLVPLRLKADKTQARVQCEKQVSQSPFHFRSSATTYPHLTALFNKLL